MSWEGIEAKLERVDELAEELDRLSAEVLLPAEPVRIDSPTEADTLALRDRVSRIVVPLRLGVLAGEGLYHLRSALDHLICDLIRAEDEDNKPGRSAQFPIFGKEPETRSEKESFDRCLIGIARPVVIEAIKSWQPYRRIRAGIATSPLLVLQRLNNFDKHNALHLHTTVVQKRVRGEAEFGGTRFVVDMDDNGDDSRLARELLPLIDRFSADISKSRWARARIVIDHPIAGSDSPADLLKDLRRRVREVVGNLGSFID